MIRKYRCAVKCKQKTLNISIISHANKDKIRYNDQTQSVLQLLAGLQVRQTQTRTLSVPCLSIISAWDWNCLSFLCAMFGARRELGFDFVCSANTKTTFKKKLQNVIFQAKKRFLEPSSILSKNHWRWPHVWPELLAKF